MESLRRHRSPGSNRFLGILSPSPPSGESAGAAVELHESDVLWTSIADGQEPAPPPPPASLSEHLSSRFALPRPPDRGFGILAALPEDDASGSSSPVIAAGPHLIQRKPSISSASSSASNSPSPASAASARMIPSVPKPKPEYSLSTPSGRAHQAHSLPVNVPVVPRRMRRFEMEESGVVDDGDGDDNEMMPPHEIVARSSGRGSPKTTFSVLEGAGRTLKGRDLRRVRDAVLRQTGFLD
ncbi:uncharacterized protein LOC122046974 [Zingiber officinale]|uniref:Senescence regulator n=1 Tax=Zingiber officinale TaxID=94328 RepID=A0A8J5HJK7_ZINOF|nr:uncharacterized protein LOC122046974 [Zingiber officinale]KAG6525635.1 hypothetical protein ZIOFF_015597 [Zingiber officinale]